MCALNTVKEMELKMKKKDIIMEFRNNANQKINELALLKIIY